MLTVEENALQGGFGSAVLEVLAEEGQTGVRVVRLGIEDHFVEHGSQKIQRSICGIDASGIVEAGRNMVEPACKQQASLLEECSAVSNQAVAK